jgi:hypothetical protein
MKNEGWFITLDSWFESDALTQRPSMPRKEGLVMLRTANRSQSSATRSAVYSRQLSGATSTSTRCKFLFVIQHHVVDQAEMNATSIEKVILERGCQLALPRDS